MLSHLVASFAPRRAAAGVACRLLGPAHTHSPTNGHEVDLASYSQIAYSALLRFFALCIPFRCTETTLRKFSILLRSVTRAPLQPFSASSWYYRFLVTPVSLTRSTAQHKSHCARISLKRITNNEDTLRTAIQMTDTSACAVSKFESDSRSVLLSPLPNPPQSGCSLRSRSILRTRAHPNMPGRVCYSCMPPLCAALSTTCKPIGSPIAWPICPH